MRIDKYKQPDGTYMDEDGVTYMDAEGWLQCKVLGFCGCGLPEHSLLLIRDALRLVKNKFGIEPHNKEGWDGWNSDNKKMFGGNYGFEYFMWYYLDKEGFTEHGGSVPGWLTDKGQDLLFDLDEYVEYLKTVTDKK